MSTLLGNLDIGKKALNAAQLGQSVTGHNIANVNTEGFSRQAVNQSAAKPLSDGRGQGVETGNIRRMHDIFTTNKVIEEEAQLGHSDTKQSTLSQVETIFTDLEGTRFRGSIQAFWNAWQSLSHEPESVPLRKALAQKAQELVQSFHTIDNKLQTESDNITIKLNDTLKEINGLSSSIAKINGQIQSLEHRHLAANDLRDKRELLLQKLSKLLHVRYYENKRGNVNIEMPNGMNLVHGNKSNKLLISTAGKNEDVKILLQSPPKVVNEVTNSIKSGEVKALLDLRNMDIKTIRKHLDTMAIKIAGRVNFAHAGGTGINRFKSTETSSVSFTKETTDQPLPNLLDGKFGLVLFDPSKNEDKTINVNVEAGKDSLTSIAKKINKAAGAYKQPTQEQIEQARENKTEPPLILKEHTPLKAIVKDGKLSIVSGMGYHYIHDEDSSNLFASLGINTFFKVTHNSADIDLNEDIKKDEMNIAAGYGLVPSDNTIANNIVEAKAERLFNQGTMSVDDFYNQQISDIGLQIQNAKKDHNNHKELLSQYKTFRDSVAAVNLDEEMTNMMKYQRAYESSAKFLNTIDSMTQTLIQM